MTTHATDLEKRIEDVIREHISECERAATAAVMRAFGAADKKRAARNRPDAAVAASSGRRTSEEVASMSARLYEAVCANPGSHMTVLASVVGGTPRELHIPMKRLRQAGRARSVGERNQTRYFPLGLST